jgi:hypothetical protein
MYVVVVIRWLFDYCLTLEETLKTRNYQEVDEDMLWTSSLCILGFMTDWAVLMVNILPSESNTDIDAAVILDWFNSRKNGKAMENNPLRIQ